MIAGGNDACEEQQGKGKSKSQQLSKTQQKQQQRQLCKAMLWLKNGEHKMMETQGMCVEDKSNHKVEIEQKIKT